VIAFVIGAYLGGLALFVTYSIYRWNR